MDEDLRRLHVERNMLQALHDTQQEHTATLRDHTATLRDRTAQLKELRQGQKEILVGVKVIRDLLEEDPGSSATS